MSKTHAEIRFEAARKRLSESLKNLERVVKEKLHQAATESRMLKVGSSEEDSESKLLQQAGIIQNLNSEINNLQKNLSELGKETEFLNEQNKALGGKITAFRSEKNSLIDAIEADLWRIEEIITNED
jgi:5-methylcytosine-specific restriction endonuclease McrBC regulatory subunit McrC